MLSCGLICWRKLCLINQQRLAEWISACPNGPYRMKSPTHQTDKNQKALWSPRRSRLNPRKATTRRTLIDPTSRIAASNKWKNSSANKHVMACSAGCKNGLRSLLDWASTKPYSDCFEAMRIHAFSLWSCFRDMVGLHSRPKFTQFG